MEEDSTTVADNSAADDTSVATGEESTTTTEQQTGTEGADNLDTSTSTETSETDDKSGEGASETKTAPALTIDDDLEDWAEKTGRAKPETDKEKALYQEIRNNQREFSKNQEAKKAQDALKTDTEEAKPDDSEEEFDDPLEERMAKLEAERQAERTARLQSEYFSENSVSEDEAKAMGTILKEMVESEDTPEEKKATFDYWTHPKRLAKWHKLAKAELGSGAVDTKAVADKAAQQERERIARESHSNGPTRNASTTPAEKSAEQKRTDDLLKRWS